MAPLPIMADLAPRKTYSSSYHHTNVGGAVGGGVVGFVIFVMIVIFLFMLWYEYDKAKRLRTERGVPISWSKIIWKSALVALTLGLVACCCAEACGMGDNNNTGNAGGGGSTQMASQPQQVDDGGGFVPQPQPTYQPNMDWAPVESVAQDGVQG